MAAVVDTGAGPSVVSEDLLPRYWRVHSWRAPTGTRIVDASGQALKVLARLPLTLYVHDKPMHFPLIVVKRLSVPLIIGCDVQRQYTKAILPQDGKIEWSTGAVSDILGYHLGARGRQYCCLPNFGRCGRSQDRVSVNCPLPDPLYPAEWMAETQFRTVDHPS